MRSAWKLFADKCYVEPEHRLMYATSCSIQRARQHTNDFLRWLWCNSLSLYLPYFPLHFSVLHPFRSCLNEWTLSYISRQCKCSLTSWSCRHFLHLILNNFSYFPILFVCRCWIFAISQFSVHWRQHKTKSWKWIEQKQRKHKTQPSIAWKWKKRKKIHWYWCSDAYVVVLL